MNGDSLITISTPPINYYWNVSQHWCQGLNCWCRTSYVYSNPAPPAMCNSTFVYQEPHSFYQKGVQCQFRMWHEGQHSGHVNDTIGDCFWD